MKRITAILMMTTASLLVFSQGQINNVAFSPSTITACDPVNLTISGTFPSSNYMGTNFAFNINGNVMLLQFFATGSGSGGNFPFSEPLPTVGPWPPGTYTFNAELHLNGNLVDTWTTTKTVGPDPMPDPGTDTFITICNSDAPFNLTSVMDGTPDPGGQWIDPFGQNHSNTFVPGVDLAGVWLYSFDQNSPCIDTLAQLFVTYEPNSNPGTNTNYSVCISGPSVDLFTILQGNPDAGGTWKRPNGQVFNGIINPATDPSGNYTYTVTGQPPCGDPTATVNLTVKQLSNAGTGITGEICDNDTAALLNIFVTGGPMTTGTFRDPFGFVVGPWATTMNATIAAPGTYFYIVQNTPCPADTAFIPISFIPCPDGVVEIDPNVVRFDLMPNPSQGPVILNYELLDANVEHQVQVIDASGRMLILLPILRSSQTIGRLDLDLSALPNGPYVIRLASNKGGVTRTMIKQ